MTELELSSRPGTDLGLLPRRLSPSRAKDYADCPRLFYQRTVLGRPSPSTLASVRGTLAHLVFERTFDIAEGQRTADRSVDLIRPAWADLTTGANDEVGRGDAVERAAEYRQLAPAGSGIETDLLARTEQIVRDWFNVEHVNAFTPTGLALPGGGSVDGRELHVQADLLNGATLHGYIDRLDRWTGKTGDAHWSISDYKTSANTPGSAKDYPPATKARIIDEAFFGLRIYALLCREQLGVVPDRLRLIYPAVGDRDRGVLTTIVTDELLTNTAKHIRALWDDIVASASAGVWPCRHGYRCADHDPVDEIA